MTGSPAIGDGRPSSAVRRSWLPRTVAALFLGAGVYAGMAVATDVIAHADEPAPTTQAEEAPPTDAQAADVMTSDDSAPADAAEPAPDDTSATSSSTPADASTSATIVSTSTTSTGSDEATGTVTSGSGDTTGSAGSQTTTTSITPTSTGTTTTSESGTSTATTRDQSPVTTAEGPTQDVPTASATAHPAAASDTVITQAQGALCEPSNAPGAGHGGSADVHHPATAHSPGTLDHGSATSVGGAGVSAAPALFTGWSTRTSDGAPLAPEPPLQMPAPTTAFGLSGCGGPGAGQGSPKGASAPATAGVLGAPLEISPAVNVAAPTAPAAGSPTLTATDPATQPD